MKQHSDTKISIEKKKLICQAFLFNIGCVIFYQLVCEVRFASETDRFLCHIFAGTHADNGTGYGYINLVTGYMIKKLYQTVPQIPWYALLQYICIFICFMIMTYVILQKNRNWGRYMTCFCFLIFLGYECYARLSYTKTACICATVSYFLLYRVADGKRQRKRDMAVAFTFFVTGYLWWNISVVLAGVMMAVPCICKFYKSVRQGNGKYNGLVMPTIAAAAFVSIALEFTNTFYIRRYPQIQEYVSYIRTFEYLDNFGWPDYYSYQPEYEALGISKNTYDMLVNDEIVLGYQVTLETLQKIRELSQSSRHGFQKLLTFTRNYPIHFFDTPLFLGALVFLFFLQLSTYKQKSRRSVYICMAALMAYGVCYVLGIDHYSHIRVCVWMITIVWIIQFLEDIFTEGTELQKYYSFAVMIVMLLMIHRGYADLLQTTGNSYKANLQQLTEWIDADKEHVYVTNQMEHYKKDGPFDRLRAGEFRNYLMTHNKYMIYQSVFLGDMMLGDLEKIRFTSEDYAKRAAAYLNEHYGGYFYVSYIADMGLTPIYMMRNGDIRLNTELIDEADGADIYSDVNMYVYEKAMMKGTIYKKGTNSFQQKVYVEVYDRDTDVYAYYDVIQEKAPGKAKVSDGKYSAVFAEVDYAEDKAYAVILAIDGRMYRVPLQVVDGSVGD